MALSSFIPYLSFYALTCERKIRIAVKNIFVKTNVFYDIMSML